MIQTLLRSLSTVFIMLVLALPLVGCESKITEERFARIVQGMNKSDVDRILGSGEDETAGGVGIGSGGMSGSRGNQRTIFRYKNGPKAIVVSFENGKVVEAVKVGF